tara:strand:+ start:18 stop:1883 length:1866 start_codon:yes stop_codon:yes gene_type:complete
MKADATLVNAAYKMGMANVPHDTSRIFQQQYAALAGIETAKIGMYGDIAESVGNVIGKGIEAYAQIKDVEQRKEWNQKYDDLAIDHLFETAQTWDDHFQKKQGIIDDDTKKHAEKEITAIKDEIGKLESDPMFIELQKGARTDSQIKKVSELRQKVAAWRNESNELLGGMGYHNNLWKNNKVDRQTSFRTQNKETGEWEVRADLASLYNHVMNPAIKLGDVNIERMRHPKTGQIGYSFNPNDDRLAQTYRLLKSQDSIDEDSTEETGDDGESRTSWISHEELMGMVRAKDDWVSTSLTGEMTEILSSADQTKAVYTRNADGTLTKSKNVQYNVNDYSDIASKAENRFFDVLMSTSQDDGQGGQMARDPQQGIIYLSNNKWLLGNTTIDYNEHSKSNPSISALSYSDLGLSGSVDTDGNNIIDTDELTDEDKEIVRNRLMRPQTQQETVIAARELARYCSLQTKGMFDNNRGNVRATVVGGGGEGALGGRGGRSGQTVNLPWQQGLKKPTNIGATAQYDLVQDILNEQKEVRDGNDIYTLQDDGTYKLTHEISGKKRSPIAKEDQETRTKVSLIQTGGGAYGNIPNDYFDLYDHDNMAPTPNTSKYLEDLKKSGGSGTTNFG